MNVLQLGEEVVSIPEHRPLGGVNRARKTVYQEISRLRHELNGVVRREPTGTEIF